MMLIEETAVPQASLPLDEFKSHLRLGTGFSDGDIQDPVLESFLRAAVSAIEARTGKILIRRDFTWVLSVWRNPEAQPLPVAPVEAVTGLTLFDRDGTATVIDPSGYGLVKSIQRPVLHPAGSLLPSIPPGGRAEIAFVAGMGMTWGDLPADIAHAVLLLAAHYHEYRHEVGLDQGAMPFGVASLIERYRTVRLLGGGTR